MTAETLLCHTSVMSNPMEKPNMDKKSSVLEALEKAAASRVEFMKKHPKFIGQDKQPEKRFEITPQMRHEAEINTLHDGESVN